MHGTTLVLFARGQEAIARKDYESAIACFTEALRTEPTDVRLYLNRALAFRLCKRPSNAIADYTEALKRDSKGAGAGAYAFRGEAYLDNHEYDSAISDFDAALQLGLSDASSRAFTYVNRGIAHDEKGDIPGAIADFTEALRINPGLIKAYHHRGVANIHKGDSDRAIADFSRFIEQDPSNPLGYASRASAYRLAGDEESAMRDERRAAELGRRRT